MQTPPVPLLGIFGGTFNPVHLGHMRLVVEVLETLRPARLDLLPSARPPHKGGRHLLPFAFRMELLRAAVAGMEGVCVNALENERDSPSYTVETLRIYRQREPGFRLFFILGAEDFSLIATWRQWKLLPELADIVVVPRSGAARDVFSKTIRDLWPRATAIDPPFAAAELAYALPGVADAGRFIHLPLPRLDIRAEGIRERLLTGRSARYLVPDTVHELLVNNPEATAAWREEANIL